MLQTYDVTNFMITYNGVEITGFGESQVFTVEWESDLFSDKNGADGKDTTRSAQNDYRANVNITLMQTSSSVAQLDIFALADGGPRLGAKTSDTTGTLEIKSLLPDGMRLIGIQSYIKKLADRKGGKEADEMEYSFRVPALVPLGKGM